MIIEILVTQSQTIDSLRHQLLDRIPDEACVSSIPKTLSQLWDQTRHPRQVSASTTSSRIS